MLEERLRKPAYSKLVKSQDHFRGKTLPEFYTFLRDQVGQLQQEDVEEELQDYLSAEELPGLLMRIRASLVDL